VAVTLAARNFESRNNVRPKGKVYLKSIQLYSRHFPVERKITLLQHEHYALASGFMAIPNKPLGQEM
jgi:hypothetical protein